MAGKIKFLKEIDMRSHPFLTALSILGMILVFGCGQQEKPAAPKSAGSDTEARFHFVTIGTGGITGVYYPTGGAIAKMVNKKKDEYGIRAMVESTEGSVFNIDAIISGDLEFGIVQSDRQYQAIKGTAEWRQKGAQTDLRAVFSIHPENVTLVAATDAGINTIADLKGKRVNIGSVGSGYRQNAIDALAANGLNYEVDFHAESVRPAEAPGLLQDGRIDAFFYTVGHPNDTYKEATSGTRRVKFVSIQNVDSLVDLYPYYARSTTPIRFYPGAANNADVPTFGVKATLVTSAKVPDDVVYAVTKEVFENLEEFKKLHPAYGALRREDMLTGISAPIHPGAMRYYKDVGLK